MARKRSPIVTKALDFLAVSCLTPMAKVRGPIARRLLLLKRAQRRRSFDLLRHHSYAFIAEYQFSPWRSPPLLFRSEAPPGRRARRFLSLLCGGAGAGAADDELEIMLPLPPSLCGGVLEDELGAFSPENCEASGVLEDGGNEEEEEEEEPSVDQKAERFIERFYEEMRIQRQESAAVIAIDF